MPEEKKKIKKINMPHVLVLMPCLILLFSLLSYVLPGGSYQLDKLGHVIPGTFKPGAAIPFSPWQALIAVQPGVRSASQIIAQLLLMGGAIKVVLSTNCFESVMNYCVYRLQDKSVKILVPSIVVMMSLLGAFAGGDSLIIFVSVGLVICAKLHLDRICAMAMFYLGYLIGQGASMTSNVLLIVQDMAGVKLLSDLPVRFVIWVIFTAINAMYCTRYATKIANKPENSYVHAVLSEDNATEEIKEEAFPLKDILMVLILFSAFILYGVGAKNWKWGMNYLASLTILLDFIAAFLYKMNPNQVGQLFFKGAQSMGCTCVVIGLARVIGIVITKSTIVYAMVNAVTNAIQQFGVTGTSLILFGFILLFNLLVPSSSSKAAILMPLICPICDVIGVSRGLLVTIYMMGDSLTNTLTPVSGPLCGSLGIADVEYNDWLKYAVPLMGILIAVGAVIIVFIAKLGIFA